MFKLGNRLGAERQAGHRRRSQFRGCHLHQILGALDLPKGVGTYWDHPETRLEDFIYQTDYPNLSIIPGESELSEIAEVPPGPKQRLLQALKRLDCDYLILNLGAGNHYNVMDFIDFFFVVGQGYLSH